jgi:hypothetical protein
MERVWSRLVAPKRLKAAGKVLKKDIEGAETLAPQVTPRSGGLSSTCVHGVMDMLSAERLTPKHAKPNASSKISVYMFHKQKSAPTSMPLLRRPLCMNSTIFIGSWLPVRFSLHVRAGSFLPILSLNFIFIFLNLNFITTSGLYMNRDKLSFFCT